MSEIKTRGALILLGSAFVAGALVLGAGCESKTEQATGGQNGTAQRGEPDGVYSVRGVIDRLPGGPNDLMIHHEAIADFTDREGTVVGMNSMTMPFPELGPDVSLDGFGVGDKVAFTLAVWWSPPAGWAVTSLEKLPAETELDFGVPVAQPDGRGDGAAAAGSFPVRGVIVTLPAAGDTAQRVTIHHEAMDGFTNPAGKVVGMRSMTMPFVADAGVDLTDLAPGVPVSMMVRVVREGTSMKLVITKISRLPEGTELDFERLPNQGG